jgi:hypothetical protein
VADFLDDHPKVVRSDVVEFLKRDFDVDLSVETAKRLLREMTLARNVSSI